MSFINAGGLEVYKKIASHYDALASEAIDPKQKEVYQKISYTYSAKVTSINTRQVEINEKLENEKIMTHSPLQERSFAGKVDTALMKRIESMTKKMIDETDNRILMTEGCIIKPKEGFTDEFNKKLSTSYAAEPTAKERTVPYVLNGKSQIVCAVAYQDLNRSTYVLEGRKLSQCMCQEMGNGYVVTSGESENSPQRIAGKPFTVPDSAGDLERHFEIDKTENGSIVLRSIDRIKNINFIMRDGAMIDTNPEGTSLNLEVGIVLNANNEWEAYEGGSIEFEVSVVNTKANMKSLLS